MNPSYLFTEGWDALLSIVKCCQSPGTGGFGEGKNKPHIVAIPTSPLVINCILLGALPALGVTMCQTHFPLLSTCQGCVSLLVLRHRERPEEGVGGEMTAMWQAGVRLWAKACESEEGRVVSLSAGSSWWLSRPKGPTVVTGSEEAADSAGGLLACCGC